MIDQTRFEVHGLYPLDGHKYLKSITVCGEKLCLIYFDSSIDILSLDELLWLYNDAVEDIGYYQMKSHELQSEVDALWQSYEELEDELYG